MKRKNYIVFLVLFLITLNSVFSQDSYTLSGYVKDVTTGEDLIGATIYVKTLEKGVVTNSYGYYSLILPRDNYTIMVSYIGYKDEISEIDLDRDVSKNFTITPESTQLEEVIISSHKDDEMVKKGISIKTISMKKIKMLPSIFGEPDVVQIVQTIPGVKILGEGSSGMFVRGGSIDQNLILYDEAPIYNPSHMFGFVSVFNPSIVKKVEMYKSGFPAKFGGRLSSVLDVKMNEGNMNRISGNGSLSILGVSASIGGPIVPDKISALVAARVSTLSLFLDNANLRPSYQDFNAKINYRGNANNRLFLSFYYGNDNTLFPNGTFKNTIKNITFTGRWNHLFSPTLFSNTSLVYNKYTNNTQDGINEQLEKPSFEWKSKIETKTLKSDLVKFLPDESKIKFGISLSYTNLTPGENPNTTLNISKFNQLDAAFYAEHEWRIGSKLLVNYGVRLVYNNLLGKGRWNVLSTDFKTIEEKTNTSGMYNSHFFVEPRVNVDFQMTEKASLKLNYTMTHQFIQLLQAQNNAYSTTELWLPSTPYVKPQRGQQFSLGYYQRLNNKVNFSIEPYYKTMNNQIDYIDHPEIFYNKEIEKEIRIGDARAYGIDFSLNVKGKKNVLTLSYTFSKAERKINGINAGKRYNAIYDLPHDVRLNFARKLGTKQKWNFSAFFIYTTGRAANFPVGLYNVGEQILYVYGERNSTRYPAYHRLDISFNRKSSSTLWGEKITHELSFGVFNVYARKNPIDYIFPKILGQGEITKMWQISFPGPIPTIRYGINF